MDPKDTKNLRNRRGTWWIHYRIPKRLKSLPQFITGPDIYVKSLRTGSLTEAKRLRDAIIFRMTASADKDLFDTWKESIQVQSERFDRDNPNHDGLMTYADLLLDSVLDQAREESGTDPVTGHPKQLTDDQQVILDAINNRAPAKHKRLRYITAKLLDEYTANKKAAKTVFKIRRSADWFLEHIIQDDIDIELIDYDQVRGFITQDLNDDVSGSTINGHLYGLTQIWNRAKQSKLVSGDNPFRNHRVAKDSQAYDPYTWDEINAMYRAADADLSILIHAAATTGARINELLTAEVKTLKTTAADRQCWLFKFKDKGKTEQSTRAVPLHPTLSLPEGFTFKMSDRTVTRRFRELKERTLGKPMNQLTGKPRKLSFHSFRSTVVTELVVYQEINEKTVGAVTGHLAGSAKVGSIRTYINPEDLESKFKTVSKLPWV